MKKIVLFMLYLWENKKKQKEKIDLFLNTNNLKLVRKINTSIILGCFNAIPSITKKDKFDLTDTQGNVFETNLTQIEVSKKIEFYEKAAKKAGKKLETFLKQEVLDNRKKILSSKYKNFLNENGFKIIRRPRSTINIELVDKNGFIRALGEENIINFINLNKHPNKDLIIFRGKKALKEDPDKQSLIYNNEKTPHIPFSEKGTSPTFKGLKAYLVEGKFGNGIIPKGDENDIAEMKKIIERFDGVIKTYLTGDRPADFKNCWRAMGVVDEKKINKYQKLCNDLELTWHHVDDLDKNLEGSFELVSTPLHEMTVSHMGSFGELKEVYNQLNIVINEGI